MNNQLTFAVKHIIILNVLMFLGTMPLGEPYDFNYLVNSGQGDFWDWKRYILALFHPSSTYFKPHQILSHMFMHADLSHLFFNMFGIYMFGPQIENHLGTRRFSILYFASGVGAFTLFLLVRQFEVSFMSLSANSYNVPMLGASGCLFGLLAAYGMLFPHRKLMLLFPPIPIKAWKFVLGYGVLELIAGLSPIQSGVAHFAHIGGGIVGFLLIYFWRKKK